MNPAKVIIGEIQSKGRSKIVPLFREGISQASESADRRSDAEVAALND